MTSPKFEIGDLVTPKEGPWHGLVGVVMSSTYEDLGIDEILVEFDEVIERMNGLACFDHYFEPDDLIKLDEAGKLIYGTK